MKISCNILKKHIKNASDIDFISVWDKFSIRTAEIENVEVKGTDIKDVVVAEVVECNAHPKKDKYHILKVNNGEQVVDILCGAPNVRKGLKTFMVKVNGMVSGFTITPKEIAGVLSSGMLCSEAELGIGVEDDGIIELPDDYIVGKSIKDYYPIDDVIVEIDNKSLTNRPDLWGHYGIAREIAAITNHELIPLELEEVDDKLPSLDISNKCPEFCNRYTGLKVSNITKNTSTNDIKLQLYYCGFRSISLLVDLTNYIMLELGQPMHAFDATKVNSIEVSLGKNDTNFITLDNEERQITSNTLMIMKDNKYFALAGIMGGLESEITSDTTSVFLESANFDATCIRKSAIRLGLRTDSSARYEKSLDPNMTEIAIKRYIKLLKSIDKNIVFDSKITDIYSNKIKTSKIKLEKEKLYKYMGFNIEDEVVLNILNSLCFEAKNNKTNFEVLVPTFRCTKDITIDVDIIEEIARMYGYENLSHIPLKLDLTTNDADASLKSEYKLKRLLAESCSKNEVNSYIWYETSFLNKYKIIKENVYLLGKKEDNILRDDLSLSLLSMTKEILKYQPIVDIFEIGSVIKNNEIEKHLSITRTEDINDIPISYNNIIKKDAVLIIKDLLNKEVVFKKSKDYDYYTNVLNILVDNQIVGDIKIFNIFINNKKATIALDINLDVLLNLKKDNVIYKEISKYPTVDLDYSVIAPRTMEYISLECIIKNFKSTIINDIRFISKYEKDDYINYTFKFTVGSLDRTLTQQDLENFKESFIEYLKKNDLNIVG